MDSKATDGLAVVLENTGEVLHMISKAGSYPTETQQLKMISEIGMWLYEQPK